MTLYKKQIREIRKAFETYGGLIFEMTDWTDEDDYKPTLQAGHLEKLVIEERFVKVEA